MAGDFRFEFNEARFQAALVPACNKAVTGAAAVMAAQASEMLAAKSYPPSSNPGDTPARDQGDLERSIAFCSPEALGTPLHAAFGTAVKYGRYLEFGAVVRPVKGEYLTVPVDRQLARKVMRMGGIRGNRALRFIPGRGGEGGVLVLRDRMSVWRGRRTGRGASAPVSRGTVVFVLKRQVVIQPRPWIVRAAEAARVRASAVFASVARAELAKAGATLPPGGRL